MAISIRLTSITVDDQARALDFYTRVMGFQTKTDVPVGEFRWLTVTSPASPDVELLLEPLAFPPARTYQKALHDAGIPATAFAVDDLAAEHKRMTLVGAVFRSQPDSSGGGPLTAVVEDGCGNLIQLFQA
jgi:catechol 2,3-dioxygenase-like lactoylglutathione lyase family enzyme